MPASPDIALCRCRTLSTLRVLFAWVNIFFAFGSTVIGADLPAFRIGEGIIAKRKSFVAEGPDKGKWLNEGVAVSCTRTDGNRIWISGTATGWVNREDFVPLIKSEAVWQQLVNDHHEAKDVAALAYIQVLLGDEIKAEQTLLSLDNSVQTDPYIRTVQALVAARDSERGQKMILRLCNDHVLTTELASMIAIRLVGDEISKELARQVVDSCVDDDCQDNVAILLCRADSYDFPDASGEALRYAKKALEIDPYYGDGRRIVASMFECNGSPDEAMRVLEEGCALFPDDSYTHGYLGFLKIEAGQIEEGLEHLKKSVGELPDESARSFEIGQTLLKRLRMHPSLPGAILPQAEIQFAKACELTNYDRFEYISSLCWVLVQQDKANEARQLTVKLAERFPRYDKRRFELEQIVTELESLRTFPEVVPVKNAR
jgi:tetratricopeptide (TPR) repeat protein